MLYIDLVESQRSLLAARGAMWKWTWKFLVGTLNRNAKHPMVPDVGDANALKRFMDSRGPVVNSNLRILPPWIILSLPNLSVPLVGSSTYKAALIYGSDSTLLLENLSKSGKLRCFSRCLLYMTSSRWSPDANLTTMGYVIWKGCSARRQ